MNFSNLKAISLVLIATVVLPGCVNMSGIYPGSRSQDANILKAGAAISNAQHDMPWPDETLWKAYHDTQLDALISQTITDNPNLHVAQARVALSQAYSDSMHA